MDNKYVVVCQAKSYAVFAKEEDLTILNFPFGSSKVNIVFRTHYEHHENGLTLPRHLYAEIHGYASCIDEAAKIFRDAANNLIPIISLSTNAYIEDLEFEIAFDNTPQISERNFMQSFHPREIGIPKRARAVDKESILQALKNLARHPEQNSLVRSIEHYRLALSYWKPRYETLAVSHLFWAAEALKLGILSRHLRETKIDMVDLAQDWKIPIKDKNGKDLPGNGIRNHLESKIRRDIIFQGDTDIHNKANDAVNGFKHGSADFSSIHEKTAIVRDQAAYYIRNAIINFLSVGGFELSRLATSPFNIPLNLPMTRYLRGDLIGESEQLADEGFAYPYFELNTTLKPATRQTDEALISFDENFIAHIGKDIVFRPKSYEVRMPKK